MLYAHCIRVWNERSDRALHIYVLNASDVRSCGFEWVSVCGVFLNDNSAHYTIRNCRTYIKPHSHHTSKLCYSIKFRKSQMLMNFAIARLLDMSVCKLKVMQHIHLFYYYIQKNILFLVLKNWLGSWLFTQKKKILKDLDLLHNILFYEHKHYWLLISNANDEAIYALYRLYIQRQLPVRTKCNCKNVFSAYALELMLPQWSFGALCSHCVTYISPVFAIICILAIKCCPTNMLSGCNGRFCKYIYTAFIIESIANCLSAWPAPHSEMFAAQWYTAQVKSTLKKTYRANRKRLIAIDGTILN